MYILLVSTKNKVKIKKKIALLLIHKLSHVLILICPLKAEK